MRKHHTVVLALICFLLPIASFAFENPFPTYYKVSEKAVIKKNVMFNPAEELQDVFAGGKKKVELNLLSWTHSRRPLAEPDEPYDRKTHFGRWVNDPNDDKCWNTRAKVLVRDSEVEVKFKGNSDCVVESGRWYDPYTDQKYTNAKDIQIDHFVPLKNAYISGGWKWEPMMKCMYGNFLSNNIHLASVNGRENMSKGDDTPEDYMPPNEGFTCEYLKRWLKVKLIWSLAMQPGEAEAIESLLDHEQCPASMFRVSFNEIVKNREAIVQDSDQCKRMIRIDPLP